MLLADRKKFAADSLPRRLSRTCLKNFCDLEEFAFWEYVLRFHTVAIVGYAF